MVVLATTRCCLCSEWAEAPLSSESRPERGRKGLLGSPGLTEAMLEPASQGSPRMGEESDLGVQGVGAQQMGTEGQAEVWDSDSQIRKPSPDHAKWS